MTFLKTKKQIYRIIMNHHFKIFLKLPGYTYVLTEIHSDYSKTIKP